LGIAEDIAGVMVYLASPAGSYMYVALDGFFCKANSITETVRISLWMAVRGLVLGGIRSCNHY
jgi:hypothetical protein